MDYLLDTCTLLWAINDSDNLPKNIKAIIDDYDNDTLVSQVSIWEIAIKHKKQPDQLPYSASQIKEYCQRAGYIFLSLSLDSISTYEKYDFTAHHDPFDQMLVAQSITNNMRIVTHDEKMKSFNIGFVELF